MNQFHTPSFGDEVFELNESASTASPMEPQHQSASRRMLSLDHSTLNDDDEEDHIDYETASHHLDTYVNVPTVMTQSQLLPQTTQLPPQQTQHHQQSQQAPAKPLAPYALFFRDTVTAIKQQNPACSLEEISAIVNTMWDALDETQKNVYAQRHELEKREYVRQLRDYRLQLSETDQQAHTPEPNVVAAPIAASTHIPSAHSNASTSGVPTEQSSAQPKVADAAPPPQQIQLLTEAATVQKCTREQCNKPAIINPDWEDEYCSNECVVIHCRNVFNEWARSLKNSST